MNWLLLLIQIPIFIFLGILSFSIPGYFLLGKRLRNDQPWINFSLATITGYVAYTLISYILLIFHINILLLILILVTDFIYLRKEPLPSFKVKWTKFNILFLVVFIIGVIGQLLVIAPSGLTINGDIVFWSAHGHDGVWHLALVEELQRNFPFQNPDFANTKLVNYHFFTDITIADLNYFFKLSPLDLYFRFFPLIFSVFLGTLSFGLGKIIGKTKEAGFWAMVFTFFAGGFGYFITFFRDHTIGGENIFWTSQVQSSSGNPPQIIAFVIVLAVLILLREFFMHNPPKRLGLAIIILTGTLAEFKIYGAVILLGSLIIISLWQLVKSHKIKFSLITLISVILSALLYLPNSASSETLLLFEPWWFVRTMVVANDKLNWLDLELRRQTYLAAHNYLRVTQLETEAFLIFLFGNLGMRFFGFWQLIKSGKNFFKDYLTMTIILMLVISLVLPMLYIQKGVPANTIQFFQYFLLIFGILAGVSVAELLDKIPQKALRVSIGALIILLAVPTQLGLLNIFYSRAPFAKVSHQEILALNYLKEFSELNSVVITPPFQKYQKFTGPTPPIWIWSDTSYVPAFSQRRAFVTDIEQLDIMGYDYHNRQDIQKQIFATTDPTQFETLLKQNHINYIYFPKAQRPVADLTKTTLQNFLNNDDVEIWKVQ
jgi:hypothetical protein